MKSKSKIVLFLIWFSIFILNWEIIFSAIELAGLYIVDFSKVSTVSLHIVIQIFTSLLFALLPLLFISTRLKVSSKISYGVNNLVITVLLVFVFANFITPASPHYFATPSVTKNLSPITTVNYLEIAPSKKVDRITNLSKKLNGFEREYFDSLKINKSTVTLYQNKNSQTFSKEHFVTITPNYHLFVIGSDEFGRDIFTRIVYGTRESVIIGFGATFISMLIGISLGFISGNSGKITDSAIFKLAEIFLSIPAIFLILFATSLLKISMFSIIIILALTGWMHIYIVTRNEIIQLKSMDFFITTKKLGVNWFNIIIREVIPYILPVLGISFIFQFANIILAESALGFLGFSHSPDSIAWGSLINYGIPYLRTQWWIAFFPAFVLATFLIALFKYSEKIKRINTF